MSARTLWKGIIHLQDHEVPVRLYAAAQDHTVRFRLLHKKDRAPVEQRMVNSETGSVVPKEKRRKGAEIDAGRFVLLSDEDLESLEPPSSRTIEVMRFVPRDVLDHEWYNRPYFLGPDDGNEDDYWALAAAVEASGQEGIARWVLRKKQYVGSFSVHGGYLSLTTLRFAQEVVEPGELQGGGKKSEVDPRELKMAEQLMAMLEGPFDPEQFRDAYRDRVVKMLADKSKGRKIQVRKPAEKKETDSLGDALKASLKAAGKTAKQ